MREKILVISDTHHRLGNLIDVLEKEGRFDRLFHLGDCSGDEEAIEQLLGCPCVFVKGNNDFGSIADSEAVIIIKGYRMLLTHGQRYSVHSGPEALAAEGRSRGVSAVLYGHTHIPNDSIIMGIRMINPGSLSLPRQIGRKPSYCILTVEDDGTAEFDIRYLEA